jgi:hypothetical protein
VIATMVPVASASRASNAIERGGQTGAKKVERPQSFWHGLCSIHDELVKTAAKRISHVAFLQSDKSGPDIDGSRPNCAMFGNKYKLFKEGKLLLTDMRRVRRQRTMNRMCCHHFWRQSLTIFRRDDMRNLRVLLQMISECWIDSRLDFGDSDSSRISHPDARLPQHCIASFLLLRLQQSRPMTLTLAVTWRKMHRNSLLITYLIIIILTFIYFITIRGRRKKIKKFDRANPENIRPRHKKYSLHGVIHYICIH